MKAQSLGSHQHSWWFSCFSLREKLARSHNLKDTRNGIFFLPLQICKFFGQTCKSSSAVNRL